MCNYGILLLQNLKKGGENDERTAVTSDSICMRRENTLSLDMICKIPKEKKKLFKQLNGLNSPL